MTDPFLKKKWERVFTTFFDINKSDSIDWNDFELLFDKIKELRGEDSTEYKIVQDAMHMVWNALVATTKGWDMMVDIPSDISISIDEWDKLWSAFDPKHMPIWQWEYLKYMFFLLDKSGDKVIDIEEYKDVMKIYGMSEEDAQKAFSQFAKDTKGKSIEVVDYGNFVRLWTDYFKSTDKSAAGNTLFGPW